jgi:hypothetical protein
LNAFCKPRDVAFSKGASGSYKKGSTQMNPEDQTMEKIDRAELLLREGKYREAI